MVVVAEVQFTDGGAGQGLSTDLYVGASWRRTQQSSIGVVSGESKSFTRYEPATLQRCNIRTPSVKSSLYINNRQPYGSLSNVLRRPAVVEQPVEGSGWR